MEPSGLPAKIRRAAQLLFFKSHRIPGVKGWELKRSLGSGYSRVLKMLRSQIEPLGVTIKAVGDDGAELSLDTPEDTLSTARFVLVLTDPLKVSDAKTSGWSIDELAGKLGMGRSAVESELKSLVDAGYAKLTDKSGTRSVYLTATGIITASSTYS
jgi:DNA-binding transcriptional ArsR family regulator